MKKLFTNEALIKTFKETVKNSLLNVEQLYRWNPAIAQLKPLTDNSFVIYRQVAAINSVEKLTISQVEDKVIYQSTGGKLEYQLIFELNVQKEATILKETFYVSENSDLPLILFAPILKNAFNRNLKSLKILLENVTKV
ncbi:hypothetical protein [Companilactobacillus musae]|uniref:hypothetical protein n=1 Tax=Companilactobacillus musae TaxID=1903258 RepID=UPI000E64E874|nr:hypothetical protein [Companilactobacillus musae]